MVRRQIERSEFVNRHKKSILALVFADVNAGKSSLGNFVGGWSFRGTSYEDLYIPHDCEIEDYSAASGEDRSVRKIDHFAENAVEATSTIQHYLGPGFDLGGYAGAALPDHRARRSG